ncbi:uncharacterized protein LOC110110741 [Dendrobium catenatum]|uniref:Uncharacterized protein n=1 Tax=Dendrobium catenatum TaxID=906689 RepID=A0A2I0X4L6_9ASPA|nr:uncharacterized protein LOC110110741 [Dendrobium catenatum]PKU82837.1 hypothetical protein MA16_Dca006135 [Dendrobium catenatum]
MAVSQTTIIALGVAFFGAMAFIFAVLAENKKPARGTAVPMKDYVMCKFPNDPTVALGSLSVVSLLISAALGLVAVFFPYKGIFVPKNALLQGMTMRVFFLVAALVTLFAEAMLMWVTITEGLHRTLNRHFDPNYECPTAKTGLFGGAAFLALDAALFWLVCQMLTLNARADYLEEDDSKGAYGEVLTTYYDSNAAEHT